MPTAEQAHEVTQNVTFMFKSFERQKQAKKLYKNIQKHYPGAKVVIADDSKVPLEIKTKHNPPTVIHMPFNSGLSKGLNLALAEVKTEYLMRMDDDELLTPLSNIYDELSFLKSHKDIDLVGFVPLTAGKCTPVQKIARNYNEFDMKMPINRLNTAFDKDRRKPYCIWKSPEYFSCKNAENQRNRLGR